MRKKLLLVAATVLAVSGAGTVVVAANDQYREYQSNQHASEQAAKEAAAAEVRAAQEAAAAREEAQARRLDQLIAECQKGEKAYAQLTAFQKTRVAAPNCYAAAQ